MARYHLSGNGSRPEAPPPGGDLRFLDPAAVQVRRNGKGKLVVTCQGPDGEQTWEGARPLRAFPLTAPDRQIALIDADDREIGLIGDLHALDRESQEALEAELEIAYLVTRVQAIRFIRSRFGVTTWELDTDRGSRSAHVKERSDIRPLSDGRLMLTDVDGVRYEIPPAEELDERSRGWLLVEA